MRWCFASFLQTPFGSSKRRATGERNSGESTVMGNPCLPLPQKQSTSEGNDIYGRQNGRILDRQEGGATEGKVWP